MSGVFNRAILTSLMKEENNTMKQEFTSANTSINSKKIPALFTMSKATFEPDTVNFDIGGGKYDTATDYLYSLGVRNFVWDKYNRAEKWNKNTLNALVMCGGADTVTISNVLNVIKEQENRHEVLEMAFAFSKPTATIYITVYEGDKSGIGKQTKADCYQLNRPTADYLEEISMIFPHVERHGKLIICNKIGDKYNV